MGNSEDFLFAAEVATKLPASTTDKDKLKLYGLYKQATAGDVSTGALLDDKRPSSDAGSVRAHQVPRCSNATRHGVIRTTIGTAGRMPL